MLSQSALRDLEDITNYIAIDDPAAARAVVRRMRHALERLEYFPESGTPGRTPDTRELVVGKTPYIVMYERNGDILEVVLIMHAARQRPASDE